MFQKKPTDRDKIRIQKETHKQFRKISRHMEKVGKDLRGLLPEFQKLPIFSSEQVSSLSKFIDEYDKFKSKIHIAYDNKVNPEEW